MFKAGFVNILGKPNAGKSTLLNELIGEKISIVSRKVQTTRKKLLGILTRSDFQILIYDTPGIIEPKYRLHEKMMNDVMKSCEGIDITIFLIEPHDDFKELVELIRSFRPRIPYFLVINKIDILTKQGLSKLVYKFHEIKIFNEIIPISALKRINLDGLIEALLKYLPESPPYFDNEEITDKSQRFLVGEIIREKVFNLVEEEVPYHTAVLVASFEEKSTLTKISAFIIVSRESQKAIILGKGGKMIREIGTFARKEIEILLEKKVLLELFVKVRPKWRDKEDYLKEYGY